MSGTPGAVEEQSAAPANAFGLKARLLALPRAVAAVGALAILVGVGLRIWSIRQARFSGEESWFWSIGCDIAAGKSFPALGHPITGSNARHPGAAFFWLLGLTQLAGRSPLAAFAAVSLGGWIALGLLSLAVARALDR